MALRFSSSFVAVAAALGLAACSSAGASDASSNQSDVTAASADDAACNASKSADGWCWAVANQPNFVGRVLAFGDSDAWVTAGRGTLARFDGTSWKPVAVPATVSAIWGTSSNDLYAVGQALEAVGFDKGVVLHFDGTTWTKVAESSRNLLSIWGRAPNDILVGGGGYSMLRFDGTSWKELAPQVSATLGLMYTSIDGTSADDIWVSSNTGDGQSPLRHWDGTTWTVGAVGEIGTMLEINSVRAFAKNDVWAGGYGEFHHFDGTKWSEVPANFGGHNWRIHSILGTSSNDLYISLNRDNGGAAQLFHWDGTTATEITDFPLEGSYLTSTGGMSLTANGTLWMTRGNSILRRKANGNFERTTTGPLTTFLRASSNGNFVAAVGRSGFVTTHTPDAGFTTARALSPVNGSEPWLFGVAAPDDKTVVAAGTGDFLTMTGTQVSPEKPWANDLPAGTGGPFVSAVAPDDVWISTRHKVFHRLGGGWAEIAPPPTTTDLGQILAVSANEVYLATDTGLYLYDRGAWTRKWEMPVTHLAHMADGSLWGSAKGRFVKDGASVPIADAELAKNTFNTTGLASCPDGRLYALTGWSNVVSFDGTSWKREDVGGYADIGGITCTADNTVWLFGTNGMVLKKTH